MRADDLQRIRASEGWRRDRVEVMQTSVGTVVIKGQRPARSAAVRRAFNGVVRAIGLPLLQLSLHDGGEVAQEVEVRRLQDLREAGVFVPEVLHTEPGFFVQRFLDGMDLSTALNRTPAERLALWRKGLEAVQAVHDHNTCLSQAFARNFIVTPQGLAAIDLEEDPLEVVSLPQAQARDWLFYLHSTLWLLPDAREVLLPIWEQSMQAEQALQVSLLVHAGLRLGWLRFLPSKRKPWGRDIVSIQAAASFLHSWARARQPS